jgi:CheY-like chemotaxis protein
MDIQMPVMDGLTATRLIRARPEAVHSIPIIAMTANVLPSHREAAAAAGMDGFVEKPIKPDVLLQTLYAAMRGESDFRTRPARSASTAPVLDLQVLANLKATFGPALVRVQATLARDAPRRLERMQAAVQTGDFNTLRREAHSLKSSSGTFGLTRVSQLSKDIEFACSEGRHKSALQSLEQLSTSLHPDLDLLARHMD